jgi:hypothetical protein
LLSGQPPSRAVIVYAYNAQAHKRFVDEWFARFQGVLHCDADPLFDQLIACPEVQPSYCNADARRKFELVARARDSRASQWTFINDCTGLKARPPRRNSAQSNDGHYAKHTLAP